MENSEIQNISLHKSSFWISINNLENLGHISVSCEYMYVSLDICMFERAKTFFFQKISSRKNGGN